MSGIVLHSKGDFSNTVNFLQKLNTNNIASVLERYGRKGVELLASSTPRNSGLTADSWGYEIEKTSKGSTLSFTNNSANDGVHIAIILQYGHGTGTGGWVEGTDYINPVIKPLFDEIINEIWKGVK